MAKWFSSMVRQTSGSEGQAPSQKQPEAAQQTSGDACSRTDVQPEGQKLAPFLAPAPAPQVAPSPAPPSARSPAPQVAPSQAPNLTSRAALAEKATFDRSNRRRPAPKGAPVAGEVVVLPPHLAHPIETAARITLPTTTDQLRTQISSARASRPKQQQSPELRRLWFHGYGSPRDLSAIDHATMFLAWLQAQPALEGNLILAEELVHCYKEFCKSLRLPPLPWQSVAAAFNKLVGGKRLYRRVEGFNLRVYPIPIRPAKTDPIE